MSRHVARSSLVSGAVLLTLLLLGMDQLAWLNTTLTPTAPSASETPPLGPDTAADEGPAPRLRADLGPLPAPAPAPPPPSPSPASSGRAPLIWQTDIDPWTTLAPGGPTSQTYHRDIQSPILLVGFDQTAFDLPNFTADLDTTHTPWAPYYSTEWRFDLAPQHADGTWAADFSAELANASTWATGHRINESRIAAIDDNPDDAEWPYVEVQGQQLDSLHMIDWLETHPEPSLLNRTGQVYPILLLNLSLLDNPTNDTDHWWYHRVEDVDAGREADVGSWRDRLLSNQSVVKPMAGYHGRDSAWTIIDPTSQTWINRWWDAVFSPWQSGAQPDYLATDWDHRVSILEPLDAADRADLATYLSTWVNDFVWSMHQDYIWFPTDDAMLQVEVRVFSDFSTGPHGCGNISWIVNTSNVHDAVQELMPWTYVNVITRCDFIDNVSSVSHAVDARTSTDNGGVFRNGWGLVNASSLHGWIGNNKARLYQPVGNNASLVVAACFVFENRSFTTGGSSMITGLGGSGVAIQAFFADRVYESGRPREGFSFVVTHEVGHAIGLAHAFTHGDPPRYAGEFTDDAMGYQNDNPWFSRIRQDSYQRSLLDLHERPARQRWADVASDLNGRGGPLVAPLANTTEALFPDITAAHEDGRLYDAWNDTRQLEVNLSLLEVRTQDSTAPVLELTADLEDANEALVVRASVDEFTGFSLRELWWTGPGGAAPFTASHSELVLPATVTPSELRFTSGSFGAERAAGILPTHVVLRAADDAGNVALLNVSLPDLADLEVTNRAPGAPSNLMPDRTRVRAPVLSWAAATDPDSDPLTYSISVQAGSALHTASGLNDTTWILPADLPVGSAQVLIAAHDGELQGPEYAATLTILPNTPPDTPTFLGPVSSTLTHPTWSWTRCSDADGDEVHSLVSLEQAGEMRFGPLRVNGFSWTPDDGLAQGTYVLVVACVDAWDAGLPMLELVSVDLPEPPGVALDLRPLAAMAPLTSVSWTEPADPDGDVVDRTVSLWSNEFGLVMNQVHTDGPALRFDPPLGPGGYDVEVSRSDGLHISTRAWHLLVREPPSVRLDAAQVITAAANDTVWINGTYDAGDEPPGLAVTALKMRIADGPWRPISSTATWSVQVTGLESGIHALEARVNWTWLAVNGSQLDRSWLLITKPPPPPEPVVVQNVTNVSDDADTTPPPSEQVQGGLLDRVTAQLPGGLSGEQLLSYALGGANLLLVLFMLMILLRRRRRGRRRARAHIPVEGDMAHWG